MRNRRATAIQKLAVTCAIQAAIVAARQEGAERIALDLEAILADMQPDYLIAA